jgi:hypothetical protein
MKLSRWFLPVVVYSYVLIYGALIYAGSGLPFVLDNNETFSSLWHAKSLSKFGINNTKGLADEVFSPHLEASPFVHSHQGNFPRLFAWLIYEFGATTAELQIAITTFTVGLGTILLAYLFFAQISSPLIALIASLVFMTDYLLFAQWQVVTYRVWYGFLFFAMMFSIEKIKCDQYIRWFVILFAASACLLYFEFIFATFVGVWCLLWTFFRLHHNYKHVFKTVLAMASGAFVGFAIFLFQAIVYLGWSDFLRDINLTFSSRNNSSISIHSEQEIFKFFESKRVIFWFNFQDNSSFQSLKAFFRSVVDNNLSAHSPSLVIIFYGLFACWLVNNILAKLKLLQPDNIQMSNRLSLLKIIENYITSSLMLLTMGLIYLVFLYSGSLELALNIDKIFILLIAVPAFLFLKLIISKDFTKWKTALYGLTTLVLFQLLWQASNKQLISIWDYFHNFNSFLLIWLIFLAIILISLQICRLLAEDPEFEKNNSKLLSVLSFMLTGLSSYGVIYYLSAGYIYSGYTSRLAPFIVFASDLVYVVVFSMLVLTIIAEFNSAKKKSFELSCLAGLLISITVLVGLLFFWGEVQVKSVKIFPPTHFDFTKKLSSPPFYGSSFVTNNYAAPVATYTNQWAYMDSKIGNAIFVKDSYGKLKLLGDDRYLWFADKKTNEAYRRPDYFICVFFQTLGSAIPISQQLSGQSAYFGQGCDSLPLVKLASKLNNSLGLKLVEIDSEGPDSVGFVRWAIVKFDWDNRLGGGLVWEDKTDISETR